MKLYLNVLLIVLLTFFSCQLSVEDESPYRQPFVEHYTTLIQSRTDVYGKDKTPMWLSSWNLETNEYPFDFTRPDSIPCRVYLNRSVDAPGGATLYWDLPDIAAAATLSEITGNTDFTEAAKAYVETYLERCTADNGIILWGNHYYYDVLLDRPVRFQSGEPPQPVDLAVEKGDLHEMRPLLPPWELLYDWFPDRVERHIRQAAQQHLADPATGEFNRHANGQSEYAFLEAGAVLVHALAFMHAQTGDPDLLKTAEKILEFSFSNRHSETGLVVNSPSRDRWDQHSSTTEIGLWSSYILKATKYIPDDVKESWINVLEMALQPWLDHGFDEEAGMFYGSLNVMTAEPIEKTDDYPYKPDTHTDIWNPLFPTHDYPMHFAECCLSLYELTGKRIYRQAAERWLETVRNQLESRFGRTLYAENYARVIHFLHRYNQVLPDTFAKEQAQRLSEEAVADLYREQNGMFRSHTREMRYDCVDGVGLLFFACFQLDQENAVAPFVNSFF